VARGFDKLPGWAEGFITEKAALAMVKNSGENCEHCDCELNTLWQGKAGDVRPDNALSFNRVVNTERGGGHVVGNLMVSCWKCNCAHKEDMVAE
jgi:hypothetical protein